MSTTNSLILLMHGESGVGKSPISHTAAAPRLVLDAENGSRFVKGRKKVWDPMTEACPELDGSWDTIIVHVRDFATFQQALSWLLSGRHPFRSVIIDSLTELQKRCRDALAAAGGMTERTWGMLLDQMEKAVRDLRDLTMHPNNPLTTIVILALTGEKMGKMRPLVQGSLALNLPGLVDVIGYVIVESDETGQSSPAQRRMIVQPDQFTVAKDRTSELETGGIVGIFGPRVAGPIDIENIRQRIYAEGAATA